ncbi:MAG: YcxB family protein [Defluviitaleaceae bacterium]|nr:YcxB family protein [Defluviitaleaceae bacterium]
MIHTFSFIIDETDYLEFAKFHHGNSRDSRKRMLFAKLVVPAVFIIWIAFQFATNRDPAAIAAIGIVFAIFSIVWIFFLSKHLLLMSMKSSLKNMKKDGGEPFARNIRLEMDEESIYQYTEKSETKVKYSQIEKIVQGQHAIYVYTSALQAFIIPFRIFESETRRSAFLDFLRNKQTT